jgi:VWFA-related protein
MPTKLFAAALLLLPLAPQQQQPVVRSGVELVRIDVQVSSRNGQPVESLKPEQFEVNIDGRKLPVVTLDFVRYGAAAAVTEGAGAAAPGAAPAVPAPGSEGRVLILAVDQASFMTVSKPAALEAVTRLAAMADPRDLIGLIAYPGPGVSFSPSRDRAALLEAAKGIDGQLQLPTGRVVLSLAESVDWTTDADYRRNIIQRECGRPDDCKAMNLCACDVDMAANEMVGNFQMQAMRSVAGLHSVVETVKQYPGRKTLVIVSAGFASSDRMGGKPDVAAEADMLGKRAAQANAVIYSLHMDVSFLYAFSAASAGRQLQTVFRNSKMLATGLDRFTGSAGGSVMTVQAGPDPALKRLLSETSAYYLLGVEPTPELRDGDVHRITVRVKQGGTLVRSRNTVLIPKEPG